MLAQLHFHEFATTRQQLGALAINSRANATLNPKAIYTAPMSMDYYLSARLVSTPLGLYDCDVPADGSTAVILVGAETRPGPRGHARGRGRDGGGTQWSPGLGRRISRG